MNRRIFCFCIVCIFAHIIVAQNTRFYSKKDIDNQFVNAICQDSNGVIWIGTDRGLRRFDGIDFKSYQHDQNDSTSLSDNLVLSLLVDSRKQMWVGTANGLCCYSADKNLFRTIPIHNVGGLNGYITDVMELPSGQIQFVASGMGAFKVNDNHSMAYPVEGSQAYRDRSLAVLYQDGHHNIWLGKERDGIVRISADGKTQKSFHLPQCVFAIVEDAAKRLIVVTNNAIYTLNHRTDNLDCIYSDNNDIQFRTAVVTKKGNVIIGTYGHGIKYMLNGSNALIDKSADIHSSSINAGKAKVCAIFEDQKGNFWIGCNSQGLLMRPNVGMPFTFFDQSDLLSDGYYTALYRDKAGSLWCAVDGKGIYQLNDMGIIVSHVPLSYNISSIFEDTHGTLWLGIDQQGLFSLNRQTLQLTKHYNINGVYAVKAITQDNDNHLFVAILGKGVLVYDLNTSEKHLITADNSQQSQWLTNYWVTSLLCDSDGLIYMGHYGGLSCYNPHTNSFVPTPRTALLWQSAIYSIIESRNKNIYMASNHGLLCLNTKTKQLTHFTTQQGLSNDIICALSEDKQGNIWCGTMNGLNKIGPDNAIKNYYVGNGLVDKSYTPGVFCTGNNDILYLAGNSGITSFNPSNIKPTKFEHNIAIIDMYINDSIVTTQTLSGDKPVITQSLINADYFHLSYADNTFTFVISTLDFCEAENLSYQYRLQEFGNEWSRTQPGDNRIQYNHLPSGNYTLQICAYDNDVCSPVKNVHIHITSPWYQTLVAKFVYSLLLLFMCFLLYLTLKRKHREDINEAKLQFFINISHEIRSPLTLIINPLERLLKQTSDADTTVMLQTMHRNSNRILSLINQLLDVRKIDKRQMIMRFSQTNLTTFVTDILAVFNDQALQKHISLSFCSSQEDIPVYIDLNNFDKVLVNILSNALKYTPCGGQITVSLSTATDAKASGPLSSYAQIVVEDNGRGIDQKELNKIFERFYQGGANQASTPIGFGIGLHLCRMLVRLHHGSIVAQNRTDSNGSRFIIKIPTGCAHLRPDDILKQAPVSGRLTAENNIVATLPEPDKAVRSKTNYKVLVVDDDQELRDFLIRNLSVTYKVDTATNGADGCKMAITLQPDVIISDVVMPEMDGFQLLKALKNNGNTNHIPIVLLTSKSELTSKIEGIDKGADGYISKPFNMEELEVLIANLIANNLRLKGKYSGLQTPNEQIDPVVIKGNNEALLARILQIINDNLNNPDLNVEMLAKEMEISRTQLHRKMKELVGMTTSDYIRNIRLRQAAMLLKKKNVNIAQVTYAVGFTNQSHFSTAFKRLYGVSPKDYPNTVDNSQE